MSDTQKEPKPVFLEPLPKQPDWPEALRYITENLPADSGPMITDFRRMSLKGAMWFIGHLKSGSEEGKQEPR